MCIQPWCGGRLRDILTIVGHGHDRVERVGVRLPH